MFKEKIATKLIRFGAAGAFGVAKGALREKTLIAGRVPLDALVGAAALLGSAFMVASRGGASSFTTSALEAVGDAGVSSYLNSMGASRGAKASGAIAITTDKKKGLAPAKQQVHGVIGASGYLSPQQLAYFARTR